MYRFKFALVHSIAIALRGGREGKEKLIGAVIVWISMVASGFMYVWILLLSLPNEQLFYSFPWTGHEYILHKAA